MPNKPEIALFYPKKDDPQSVVLFEELLNRGAKVHFLPFKLEDASDFHLASDSTFYENKLENTKAVFIRNISVDLPYLMPPYINQAEYYVWKSKYLKENYKIFSINSLLQKLESNGTLIVNNLRKYLHHSTKAHFFTKLRQSGISTPDLIATNSIDELKDFANKYSQVILKSASGIGGTRLFNSNEDILKSELNASPAFLQERIEGFTARIHTVGDKVVLALKIYSDDIDSRTETQGFEVIELTEEQKEQVIKANKLFDIKFSAWDAIIDKNKHIYLVDCNPGPYIWWIGPYFTRYVKQQLANYLITFAVTNSLEEANNAIKLEKTIIGKMQKYDTEIEHLLTNSLQGWQKSNRQYF